MITWTEAKRLAPKRRDTWSRIALCNPIALPLTYILAKHTKIPPITLTVLGFIVGIGSGVGFLEGNLILGAILYYLHFLLDGMDGKLSRLRNIDDTYRGMWDFLLDGTVWLWVVLSLMIGSKDTTLVVLLIAWIGLHFLDMRISALMYRLMALEGITSKWVVDSSTQHIYPNNLIFNLYYRISQRADKIGINVIPTIGESCILTFIVGPILWALSHNVWWIYAVTIVGLMAMLPSLLGVFVITHSLARRKRNAY
jgi:phosphatidylglycerophosphate synthase